MVQQPKSLNFYTYNDIKSSHQKISVTINKTLTQGSKRNASYTDRVKDLTERGPK